MYYEDLAKYMYKIRGKNLYITTDPLIPDWTSDKTVSMKISSPELSFQFDFPKENDNYGWKEFSGGFNYFFKEMEESPMIFGWDIKNIISYLQAKTGLKNIFGNVLDLRVLESFFGVRDRQRPGTYAEVISRYTEAKKLGEWSDYVAINNNVFQPLITSTLPDMECTRLINKETKSYVYSHYVAEGTTNGRMKCLKAYRKSYMPHSLSKDDKEHLYPEVQEDNFLYLDYKNMEVFILQWLSQDEHLGELLQEDDIYSSVWREITTNKEVEEELRNKFKRVFLSIIYGAGVSSVAKRLEVSEGAAKVVIEGIKKLFPKAIDWSNSQLPDPSGVYTDHFGRKIQFSKNEYYKILNFAVSAPASTICLHKLNILSKKLEQGKVVFHIHDGYCILTNRNIYRFVCQSAKDILEQEEEFYPGLKLKVACQVGKSLNSLIHI